MKDKIIDNSGMIADVATRVSYGGSSAAIIGGLTLNEWAAIVGIIVAVVTCIANMVFRTIEHRARMNKLVKVEDE